MRLYRRGDGIVVEEPAVVAVDKRSGDPVDFGRSALQLANDNPTRFEAQFPVASGAVVDEDILYKMLTRLIRPNSGGLFDRVRLLICVTSASTVTERKVIREAARRAGGASVHLIEHAVAAALGANLQVHEPVATTVLDIGGGVTEAAVMSLGSVVACASVRSGGIDIDNSIKQLLRRDYAMRIDDNTAEGIKIALSHLDADALQSGGTSAQVIEARGEMLLDGSTMTAILEQDELVAALEVQVNAANQALRECLVQVSAELAEDVFVRGIHMCGGGALLGGLAPRISAEFNIPTHVMAEADRVGVMGAGKCLEAMETLRGLFVSD